MLSFSEAACSQRHRHFGAGIRDTPTVVEPPAFPSHVGILWEHCGNNSSFDRTTAGLGTSSICLETLTPEQKQKPRMSGAFDVGWETRIRT